MKKDYTYRSKFLSHPFNRAVKFFAHSVWYQNHQEVIAKLTTLHAICTISNVVGAKHIPLYKFLADADSAIRGTTIQILLKDKDNLADGTGEVAPKTGAHAYGNPRFES